MLSNGKNKLWPKILRTDIHSLLPPSVRWHDIPSNVLKKRTDKWTPKKTLTQSKLSLVALCHLYLSYVQQCRPVWAAAPISPTSSIHWVETVKCGPAFPWLTDTRCQSNLLLCIWLVASASCKDFCNTWMHVIQYCATLLFHECLHSFSLAHVYKLHFTDFN